MNKKPTTFDEAVIHYNKLIKSQMKNLHIYKNHEEYYQAGMIALWEALCKYDETKGSFSNYAFHTVRGRLMTKLRLENTYESRYQPSELIETETQVYEPNLLEKEILESYCQYLSPNQQKVILARFYENKSFKQIAKEEGVPTKTVRSWYRYACENLRKQIQLNQE